MSRKFLAMTTVTTLLAVSFLFGAASNALLPGGKTARKIGEVCDRIRLHYPEPVTDEKVERAAIEGMLAATDDWGQYFTAEEWLEWSRKIISGKYHGVGIQVEFDAKAGYLRVTSPFEDSPAFDAGIVPGDLIVGVDGVDVRNRPQEETIARIKGDIGTKVSLKIHRGVLQPFEVSMTRAEIKRNAVKARMVAPGVGHIRIEDFTESMPRDFEAAWRDLEAKGIKALVIDLRFNGGGLLRAAVELCDFWLPAGKVVAMSEGRRPEYRRIYRTERNDVLSSIPMVILVNQGTASASEIVAGAFRDHGLAPLVGSRTFGKGLVQSSFDLSDGAHLKLTTARWVTPDGEQVGAKDAKGAAGLVPEYVVEMSRDEEIALLRRWHDEAVVKGPPVTGPPPRDYALEAGLEILRAKLENRPPKVERREIAKTDPKESK